MRSSNALTNYIGPIVADGKTDMSVKALKFLAILARFTWSSHKTIMSQETTCNVKEKCLSYLSLFAKTQLTVSVDLTYELRYDRYNGINVALNNDIFIYSHQIQFTSFPLSYASIRLFYLKYCIAWRF